MIVFPEQNSGTYFAQQRANSNLYQWFPNAPSARPIERAGRHLRTLDIRGRIPPIDGQIATTPYRSSVEDDSDSRITYPCGATPSQTTN